MCVPGLNQTNADVLLEMTGDSVMSNLLNPTQNLKIIIFYTF